MEPSGPSGAGRFALLWESLADILGTAATAALLRRAARRASPGRPELLGLVIARDNFEYRYTLPPGWSGQESGALLALKGLVSELKPLLVEMTGVVIIRHLEKIPELRELGFIAPPGVQA